MPDVQKLLSAIDAAEQSAYGSDTDAELSADRARAIDLFLGRDVDPPPPGRSSVLDRSVYETVQWILPSLCRIFASGENVVEFQPIGPEDEPAAKQESEYMNHVITQKNKWFDICYEWFTDALITKNAYCWAYMDKRRSAEIERYENQTMEGVLLLQQDQGVEILSAEPADETQQTFNVTLRRSKEKPHLCLSVLPPERVKVSHNTPGYSLKGCDYFEYWDYQTISDLRRMGFDLPDDVADSSEADTDEDNARDLYNENFKGERTDAYSAETRRVRVRYVWIVYDYDEDGIAELNYVLRVGEQVLAREEVSRIPVASIVPNPLPHRHVGLSIADIVGDLQRISTAILRQGLDNLYFANNPAIAFNKNTVNLDDVLTSRPGARIRVDGSPQTEFMPVVQPVVFPQAMEALGFMEQVKEGRTGVNRYFQGTDQNSMNKTASGIQQLSSMAAQRVEMIARIFASGIEELFSIAHELILKSGHQREVIKLTNGWVQVDPSQWRKRDDLKLVVGFAAGNKDAQMNRLMQIGMLQKEALAGGLPIVTPQNVYQTALEITKASDFSTPERFWTDPSQIPPPPPPQPDVTVVTAEKIKSETALKTAEIKSMTDILVNREKLGVEQQKIAIQPELEREKLQTQVQIEAVKGENAAQLEERRAALNPKLTEARTKESDSKTQAQFIQQFMESQQMQTQTILQALQQVAEAMKGASAPREIVRDKDGRAMGSRPVAQ